MACEPFGISSPNMAARQQGERLLENEAWSSTQGEDEVVGCISIQRNDVRKCLQPEPASRTKGIKFVTKSTKSHCEQSHIQLISEKCVDCVIILCVVFFFDSSVLTSFHLSEKRSTVKIQRKQRRIFLTLSSDKVCQKIHEEWSETKQDHNRRSCGTELCEDAPKLSRVIFCWHDLMVLALLDHVTGKQGVKCSSQPPENCNAVKN